MNSGAILSADVSVQSPSLRLVGGQGAAYELKFLLGDDQAAEIEAWAREQLTPDPHGQDGCYRTTSVYCDTPALDVYHRSDGFRRTKFRLRRYGSSPLIYLERKNKRGDRVRKRRDGVSPESLGLLDVPEPPPDWPGGWFLRKVQTRGLRPVCRVAYERTAFHGSTADGPVRLTLDRGLVGVPATGWGVTPLAEGAALLPGGALLELKFQDAMPALFKRLLPVLPSRVARVSKYRLCVDAWRLAGEGR